MIIDTHAHLDDEKYKDNQDQIIEEALQEDVRIIINPGVNVISSKKSIELSKKFSSLYAAVGIHPHDLQDVREEDYSIIEVLSKDAKVVGIGEIGLDYYYEYTPKEQQILAFENQIEIANKVNLPVIIHSRDAHQDTYDILKRKRQGLKGVLHSYSGSWEMAKRFLDLGLYLSFSGPITFKNARKLPEVVEKIPIDRLMIETDSPYLTPVPYRGKRNHPQYVKYVAYKISEIRNCSIDYLLDNIEKNVYNLFDKIKHNL